MLAESELPKLSNEDLSLLTDRELFEVSTMLGIVYKGRNNAIRDIEFKLPSISPTAIPKQLKNLQIAKQLTGYATEHYQVTNILSRPEADIQSFVGILRMPETSVDTARCDLVKILAYANKLFQSNLILAMHPNFNEICKQLAGTEFVNKLQKLATELGIDTILIGEGWVDVLLLKVLDRWPIKEPSDINWGDMLKQAIANPEILKETFKYFGKLGLFNQLYLYYQLSLEGKAIQPITTVVEWEKMGVEPDYLRAQPAYSIIVPKQNGVMYSPSVFSYDQTGFQFDRRVITFPSWACDVSRVNVKEFSRAKLRNLVEQRLHPDYWEYTDLVFALISWCFDSTEPALEVPEVLDSDTALKVIQAASDILRLSKINTTVTYPN